MSGPKVSIIIPAYNADATLAETLASLQSQTCTAWEAIVVDDGSTDRTSLVATAAAAADMRIRVVRQPNGGESAARNTGIAHASSGWLMFLDSDDWLLQGCLERLTAETSTHPEADVIHCGWVRVASDGQRSVGRYAPSRQDLFVDLAQYNCFAIHAAVVRRSVVDVVGPFDVGLKTCADWDFWQRVARTGARFASAPEVLACYRLRPDSSGTHAHQLLVDALTVIHRGHLPDPRVSRPAAPYAEGMPPQQEANARIEFACWAAGLSIGRLEPATPLLDLACERYAPAVAPELVGQILFDSVPTPFGELPAAWVRLWPQMEAGIDTFLQALETRVQSPGLAAQAKSHLMQEILREAARSGQPDESSSGQVSPFGARRLVNPVSRQWGFDRGRPVDRYYIERFLASHEGDVSGRVLEVGDDGYTLRYGGNRVTASDVLDVSPDNPNATIVGDLTQLDHVQSDVFDCIVLTQTIQLIYDSPAVVRTLYRILKPGGVLLTTFPALTRSSQTELPGSWFWRLTPASAQRLFEDVFPSESFRVTSYGNVLAACAFLYGVASEELSREELDHEDPEYDVIVAVRAAKPSRARVI